MMVILPTHPPSSWSTPIPLASIHIRKSISFRLPSSFQTSTYFKTPTNQAQTVYMISARSLSAMTCTICTKSYTESQWVTKHWIATPLLPILSIFTPSHVPGLFVRQNCGPAYEAGFLQTQVRFVCYAWVCKPTIDHFNRSSYADASSVIL